MKLLFSILHTFFSRFLLLLLMVLIAIPLIICLLIPKRWRFDNPVLYWIGSFFYWAVLKGLFVPITFKGQENIPDEPAIFAANHQSSFDIPLVGVLLKGKKHVWLATTDLLKSPIFKYFLPRTSIMVDVSSPLKAMRSIMQAIKMVNDKDHHIMIFPEGARFSDDDVHEFYGGFVLLAKKTGRPVVPVRIFHANKVYSRNAFLLTWHPITVVVGKPFVYQDGETNTEFKDRVYKWFVEQKE